jgi:hypothetical protein
MPRPPTQKYEKILKEFKRLPMALPIENVKGKDEYKSRRKRRER